MTSGGSEGGAEIGGGKSLGVDGFF